MGQHWFSAKWLKCPLSSRCFAQPSSPWALTQRRRRLLNGKIRAVAVTRHILVRRNIGFLRTQRSRAWKGSNYIISLKILLACWKSGIEIWMDPDLQCSASLLSVLIIDGFVCYMYLSSCASNPLLQSQKARALFKGRKLVGFGPFGGGQLWKYEILKDLEDLDAQYTFGTFGMEHGSMMVSKFDAWNWIAFKSSHKNSWRVFLRWLQTRATSLKDFHGSMLFQIRARHEIVAGQVLREAEGELQEQARKIAPTLPTSTSCMKGVKKD